MVSQPAITVSSSLGCLAGRMTCSYASSDWATSTSKCNIFSPKSDKAPVVIYSDATGAPRRAQYRVPAEADRWTSFRSVSLDIKVAEIVAALDMLEFIRNFLQRPRDSPIIIYMDSISTEHFLSSGTTSGRMWIGPPSRHFFAWTTSFFAGWIYLSRSPLPAGDRLTR